MNWVHAVLAWINHPHGVVLIGLLLLGLVTMTATWPIGKRSHHGR